MKPAQQELLPEASAFESIEIGTGQLLETLAATQAAGKVVLVLEWLPRGKARLLVTSARPHRLHRPPFPHTP